VIRNADWIIDLGPEGGEDGGRLVAEGRPAKVAGTPESFTGQFLKRYYASNNGHLEPVPDDEDLDKVAIVSVGSFPSANGSGAKGDSPGNGSAARKRGTRNGANGKKTAAKKSARRTRPVRS